MKIIDLHCDTIFKCFIDPQYQLTANSGHIDMDKLNKGNAMVQFFALFIYAKRFPQVEPFELFLKMYEIYLFQLSLNQATLAPALTVKDIETNVLNHKVSSVLSIEDGVIIHDKIERLAEIYEKGVRLLTLTWNFENNIGYPSSIDSEEHKRRLKPLGFDVVSEMNRLGMIIDVSHLSEGGFYDVALHSKKPFVASHSCARTLCKHQRNLTDEQLKTLGEKGGLVGINFYSYFLEDDCDYAKFDHLVNHIKHMVNKAGIEAVGIGSDFDGIDCGLEFKDYGGFPSILDALSKHFTHGELERICHKNALRLMKDVWRNNDLS